MAPRESDTPPVLKVFVDLGQAGDTGKKATTETTSALPAGRFARGGES
jgi:hypothetical protein